MKKTSEATALTSLILEVFRLNGQLLSQGNRLTEPLGLTSARWQVLGSIKLAGHPISVAQAARRMGLTRQAVQRVANDLETLGFTRFENNPDHARAKLIVPTAKGRDALELIEKRQIEWSNKLAKGINTSLINNAVELFGELHDRCNKMETTPIEA
ncbi:MAG: MarR family transcriptional regulator [bacterium]|nr:MarR family transcriptional regulator [bacterium]